jgi:acyl phosphate:glycerol-3-phosphate acyltransferase
MAAIILLAYAIGSIPFALLLARRWGSDLRRVGSGNLGAANVMRASGLRAGVLVAILDIGKGALSVALAERLSTPPLPGVAAIPGR